MKRNTRALLKAYDDPFDPTSTLHLTLHITRKEYEDLESDHPDIATYIHLKHLQAQLPQDHPENGFRTEFAEPPSSHSSSSSRTYPYPYCSSGRGGAYGAHSSDLYTYELSQQVYNDRGRIHSRSAERMFTLIRLPYAIPALFIGGILLAAIMISN